MHRSVLDAVEMAKEGYSVVEIKKILEETREKMTIYIGLSTLKCLKKGGRVSSVTEMCIRDSDRGTYRKNQGAFER